jgi:hypothetical protein
MTCNPGVTLFGWIERLGSKVSRVEMRILRGRRNHCAGLTQDQSTQLLDRDDKTGSETRGKLARPTTRGGTSLLDIRSSLRKKAGARREGMRVCLLD